MPALDAGANLLMQTFDGEPDALLKEWAKKKIVIQRRESEEQA